jgi:DNA-binding PadR family transcriptional regulator
MSDRNVVYMMLAASGWIRDTDEEAVRGTRRIYIRTGLGQRDLGERVQRFCEPLEERLELRQGDAEPIRLVEEPVYLSFERRNPGIADLLPDTDGPIR